MIISSNSLHYIITGEKLVVHQDIGFDYYLMKDNKKTKLKKAESKLSEDGVKKIDIYGIKINIIPFLL